MTEVANSRAPDKCKTRPGLCVWFVAWPRCRLVVNLRFYPKGSQRQADARGWGGGVAEERCNPLELGARGPASPTPIFF